MAKGQGYSPLYRGVWQDEHLEGAPFEEKAFFIFLFSHERIRPSGIYRATDEQLAADTGLQVAKVKTYLADLAARRRIVRDGAWIFVRGYLSRQPQQERLLLGVQADIASCSSLAVLESFSQKYPLRREWSEDRLEMVGRPMNGFVSPEQSRAVTEQSITTLSGSRTADPQSVDSDLEAAREVLTHLNDKAESKFRAAPANLDLIRARLQDGITVAQLTAVVDLKCREWKGDPMMAKFLRPTTLFNRTKCEQYIGEASATAPNGSAALPRANPSRNSSGPRYPDWDKAYGEIDKQKGVSG